MTKTLAGLALLGWGLFFWMYTRPKEAPKTIVQKEYVDRIVTKTVTKTTTTPDGTKILEQINTNSQEIKQTASQTIITAPLTRWGLGISLRQPLPNLIDSTPIPGVLVGYRLFKDGPLWIHMQLDRQLSAQVSLSVEF